MLIIKGIYLLFLFLLFYQYITIHDLLVDK